MTNRYLTYLVVKDGNGNTLIQKRTAKGIWHPLYEYPLLETPAATTQEEAAGLIRHYEGLGFVPLQITLLHPEPVVHKLSHQHLYVRFWEVKTDSVLAKAIGFQEVKTYPFPVVIYNFIEKHWE